MKKAALAISAVILVFILMSCPFDTIDSPTNLQASSDFNGYIELTWTAVARAFSYNVYASSTALGAYTWLAGGITGTSTSMTVSYQVDLQSKALSGSGPFFFKVSAVSSSGGESDLSNYAEGSAIALAAPTGVSATDGTYGDRVVISWNEVNSATRYNIYRSTTETGTYSFVGFIAAPALSGYNSTSEPSSSPITVGTTYFFKVSSQDDDDNESELSASDQGWAELQGPAAPTFLSASQGAFTSTIKLDWTTSTGASSYYVYSASSSTGTQTYLGEVVLSYANIINLPYGVTRYYWVSAVDSVGTEGAKSSYMSGYTFKNGKVNFTDDGSGNYLQFYTNQIGDLGGLFYSWNVGSTLGLNDTLQTTVNKKSGDDGTSLGVNGFGVIFRFQDLDNFMVFLINVNGRFAVWQKMAGAWNYSVIAWADASAIVSGYDSENTLKVYYYLDGLDYRYDLYVNNSPVGWVTFASYVGGYTGILSAVGDSSYEDFPDFPVDVRFRQTLPILVPSSAVGAAVSADTEFATEAIPPELAAVLAEADTAASSDVAGPENEGAGLGELSPGLIWLE